MAITGKWKNQRVQAEGYSGAMRWGTGINPIHAQRDPVHHPLTSRIPLRPPVQDNYVPEEIIGPSQWGYHAEDMYIGEDYEYLREDHPNWGDSIQGRPDRTGAIFEAGLMPQSEGWPSWGPHGNNDGDFPLPSGPGGGVVRSHSSQLDLERQRAIAVPTPGVSGGWKNKLAGDELGSQTSSQKQYEIRTSMAQRHNKMLNERASRRGTDEPRSSIASRIVGPKIREFGKSLAMGGGPGTPDMRPRSQEIMYRPFYFRSAGVPPTEQHFMNTMEQRTPYQRQVPPDPYQGDYAGSTVPADYGYSTGDYYS